MKNRLKHVVWIVLCLALGAIPFVYKHAHARLDPAVERMDMAAFELKLSPEQEVYRVCSSVNQQPESCVDCDLSHGHASAACAANHVAMNDPGLYAVRILAPGYREARATVRVTHTQAKKRHGQSVTVDLAPQVWRATDDQLP